MNLGRTWKFRLFGGGITMGQRLDWIGSITEECDPNNLVESFELFNIENYSTGFKFDISKEDVWLIY